MKINNSTGNSVSGIHKRAITGTVVSVKNIKTVVVAVAHTWRHPLYKKTIRMTRRFPVHNEKLVLAPGDKVTIVETRPISKTKHFQVIAKVGGKS